LWNGDRVAINVDFRDCDQRPAVSAFAFTMSAERRITIVNETYIRREEATSSMEQSMTPSSRIMANRACFGAFALIISSMPAIAGAPANAAPVLNVRGAMPVGKPLTLGGPAATGRLGVARHDREHRRFGQRFFGGGTSFAYAAPVDAPSARQPDFAPPPGEDDGGYIRPIACAHTRVIEIGPVAASSGPLPRVIYGSPPPCAPRRYVRSPYRALE
jgi:hypothetical protein